MTINKRCHFILERKNIDHQRLFGEHEGQVFYVELLIIKREIHMMSDIILFSLLCQLYMSRMLRILVFFNHLKAKKIKRCRHVVKREGNN